MKTTNLNLLAFLFLLIFSACKQDEPMPNPDPNWNNGNNNSCNKTCKIKSSFGISSNRTISYTYNAQGFMETYNEDGWIFYCSDYLEAQNYKSTVGSLPKITYQDRTGQDIEVTYNTGAVFRRIEKQALSPEDKIIEFTFNADGYPTSFIEFWEDGMFTTYWFKTTYTWKDGNCTKAVQERLDNDTGVPLWTEYEFNFKYDDKKNPFKKLDPISFDYYYFNNNNIIEFNYISGGNSTTDLQSYDYNDDCYPVSIRNANNFETAIYEYRDCQ